ncbi:DUF2573 family protein [Bacillus sp. FJAT-42376]|uniref:DUF2573 family protein n=1 Tax=Bacillus sp. FJAT-42376 TaxID=2014076 RepID=UPI000F4F83F7|nr:DUF2573 family protein [Bacillus sp. FJAT-42376]AZB44327.1 DUF2573 family protein [Bacillus sp. FJAT-42376]
MDKTFKDQFDGLFEKYCELLVGSSASDQQEKIQMWALYTHMAKTMPNLLRHWNAEYPEFKNAMKQVSTEVKEMNEQHRENSQKKKDD